ncbi:MAG: TetR/AcrR family transcriptional regulator [Promethearchaeota archaeon]
MNIQKRKTRARSPEKKAEQFDKILEVGKEMFIKYGVHGFSTRALADKLGMTQPNLYNYVNSKRELWIAIKSKYYDDYFKGFEDILDEHKGLYLDLFYKFIEYFIEFLNADYERFQIMFILSAPPSKRKGPLEKSYKTFPILKFALGLVEKAAKNSEISSEKATELFYSIYSYVLGATKVRHDLSVGTDISEFVEGFAAMPYKEYLVLLLKEIRERIDRSRKKLK